MQLLDPRRQLAKVSSWRKKVLQQVGCCFMCAVLLPYEKIIRELTNSVLRDSHGPIDRITTVVVITRIIVGISIIVYYFDHCCYYCCHYYCNC